MAYGIMYNGLYFCCLWLTFCVLLFGLADIVTDLEHHLDARWKHFGVHLEVEWSVLDAIEKDRVGKTDDCMLELMGKWVSSRMGTGSLPRTWQTIVEAVKKTGYGGLAESIAYKHGVDLTH